MNVRLLSDSTKAKDYFSVQDPDFYEVEAHIFFDDAFERTDSGGKTINMFVKELVGAMDKAASLVHDIDGMKMTPPVKTPTPYGGRLTWKLPGGNLLMVHLKDKKKVRDLNAYLVFFRIIRP